MEFDEILFWAQVEKEEAVRQILEMFKPMLIRNALVKGKFDEDLYQELIVESLKCIKRFKPTDSSKY